MMQYLDADSSDSSSDKEEVAYSALDPGIAVDQSCRQSRQLYWAAAIWASTGRHTVIASAQTLYTLYYIKNLL